MLPYPRGRGRDRRSGRGLQMRAAIIEALQSADHPLTLGELAASVAQPWRAVGYSLFQLVQSGMVDRLEGGTYTLSTGAHLSSEPRRMNHGSVRHKRRRVLCLSDSRPI